MSIWQTQLWQDMLIASGQSEEYFIVEREGGYRVFVEKRKVSFWEYGLFIIGYEWILGLDLQESLQELCREEKCLFVQLETINYNLHYSSKYKESWHNWYYKKFIPPYTCIIDLEKSLDDILKSMKPKGRYNIKLARKKWVVVEQVEKTPENIYVFYSLIKKTTSRDNFAWNTREYYKIFLKKLKSSQLLFAYFKWEVIAAGIFIFSKERALYYYGASGNIHRNLMAPYLLQWGAIELAKEKWCKIYDFLGVAGPNEKKSPLAWVTDFKKKFSKDIREVSESYIYIRKKIKYFIIQALKKFKK